MDINDRIKDVDLHLVLGNQLFPISNINKINPTKIFMREDYGLCTYEKHHKHKITLFLSSMRSYKDYLNEHNYNVHYEYLNVEKSISYIDSLKDYIIGLRLKKLQSLSEHIKFLILEFSMLINYIIYIIRTYILI